MDHFSQWLSHYVTVDLARLTGPVSLIVFIMVVDALSRMVPVMRDHLRPLLGVPFHVFTKLQQRLARASRSGNDLKRRGIIAIVFLLVIDLALAWLFDELTVFNHSFAYIMWFLVWRWSVGWTVARDILALEKPNATQLKKILARRKLNSLSAIPDQADPATIYRHTIEVLAMTLVHGLFAPLVYALLAGVFGYQPLYGAIFGVVGTVLAESRPKDATQRQFQALAQPLGEGILFLPSRIAGLILLLAAICTPKSNIFAGFNRMIREGHRYPSFSLGWAMALISGALGIAFPLHNAKQDWLGGSSATARIEKGMLQRVLWLHVVTVLITALILCALLMLSM